MVQRNKPKHSENRQYSYSRTCTASLQSLLRSGVCQNAGCPSGPSLLRRRGNPYSHSAQGLCRPAESSAPLDNLTSTAARRGCPMCRSALRGHLACSGKVATTRRYEVLSGSRRFRTTSPVAERLNLLFGSRRFRPTSSPKALKVGPTTSRPFRTTSPPMQLGRLNLLSGSRRFRQGIQYVVCIPYSCIRDGPWPPFSHEQMAALKRIISGSRFPFS